MVLPDLLPDVQAAHEDAVCLGFYHLYLLSRCHCVVFLRLALASLGSDDIDTENNMFGDFLGGVDFGCLFVGPIVANNQFIQL
jgi:hypothetical protein